MVKNDNKGVVKAAGTVGSAIFISRILGFIRDMVIARFIGTGMTADAFFLAFRIPNLLRRLLAEGAMSASFIPVFTEYLKIKGKEESWKLAHIITSLLIVVFFAVTICGIVFAPEIVWGIGHGFVKDPDKFALTVRLTRIMFPFIFFIGMAAFLMGILNSLKIFFVPAFAPVFFNIAIIFSALFLSGKVSAVTSLAIGVLLGGFLQFAVQIPRLLKEGFRFKWSIDLKHEGVRRIGKLFLPALVGAAPLQLNIFITDMLATHLKSGSVSYLYYANRLVQFPLAIFGIATGIAVLPIMSEHIANADVAKMKETFVFATKFVMLITIPAAVGLIILRFHIINVLFEYGKFNRESTHGAMLALLYYSLGLCAFAGLKVIVPAFYSMQDTKTPVKIACYSMAINILLSIILMQWMEHAGLAFATSLSSAINLIALIVVLQKKVGRFRGKGIVISIIKSVVAAVVMGAVIYYMSNYYYVDSASRIYRALILFCTISSGILVYIGVSVIMRNEEMSELIRLVKGRMKVKL